MDTSEAAANLAELERIRLDQLCIPDYWKTLVQDSPLSNAEEDHILDVIQEHKDMIDLQLSYIRNSYVIYLYRDIIPE